MDILTITISFLLGFAVAWLIFGRRPSTPMVTPGLSDDLISQQTREKAENLEKVKELFEHQERVTNDDVEKALGVSDATATRYLEELEKEGLVRQVGETGKYTYYEKV